MPQFLRRGMSKRTNPEYVFPLEGLRLRRGGDN